MHYARVRWGFNEKCLLYNVGINIHVPWASQTGGWDCDSQVTQLYNPAVGNKIEYILAALYFHAKFDWPRDPEFC